MRFIDPLTGEELDIKETHPSRGGVIVDLGSCAGGNTISLRKDVPEGRYSASDQFTLQLTGGGLPSVNLEEYQVATTSGVATGIQTAMVGPLLAIDGTQLTLNEVSSGTTDFANYTRSWQCVDTANGDTPVGSGTSLPGTITMPTPSAERGSSVVCTIANTLNASLTVQKRLPNGRILPGDQFLLDISRSGTSLNAATTTGNTNAPVQQATITTADLSEVFTVSEAARGTTNLADYVSTYACTNSLPGGQTPSGFGTTFEVDLQPGDGLLCTFRNELQPKVNLSKTAAPASGIAVNKGEVLTYTLAVEVINGPTLSDIVLTDNLGQGLEFGGLVGDFRPFIAGPTPNSAILPAGTGSGTYRISYTATVLDDAVTSVNNSVSGIGGGHPDDPGATNPVCAPGACTTTHPLDYAVLINKDADPDSGTPVEPGDVIGYSIRVEVVNGPTFSDVEVVDSQGPGLTMVAGSEVLDSPFEPGSTPGTYILPEGTATGFYSIRYQAEVDSNATGSVSNAVEATGGGSPLVPDYPGPECETVCETEHPIKFAVLLSKDATPAPGTEVKAGTTLTYTLTVNVVFSATQSDVIITDVLGEGLTYTGVVGDSSPFTDIPADGAGPELRFTLPAGTPSGEYTITYAASVGQDASVAVNNSVTGAGGGVPGDPNYPGPICMPDEDHYCETRHPVEPQVLLRKEAAPVSGTPVVAGQMLTYTLTVEVLHGPTQTPVVLTDTLGEGLTFVQVNPGSDFIFNPQDRTLTLPTGAETGVYSVSYTASVDADAEVSVNNTVAGTGGGNPNSPNPSVPTCAPGDCTTGHPVEPELLLSKTSVPESWTEVVPGDTLTYTLTVEVLNGPTQSDVVLTDTLGPGLVFDEVTSAGGFTHDPSANTFTLSAGAASGTHSVTYTAKVEAGASVSVHNSVLGTGGGNPNRPGSSDPSCAPNACDTTHLIEPEVHLSKTASPVTGTAVAAGQTVTYTLSVVVINGPTQSDVVLTDTLGNGLSFDAVVPGSDFEHDESSNSFTLPAGAATGTYSVSYTATVDADASVSVNNSVDGTGGGNPDDPNPSNPVCAPDDCETRHPVNPEMLLSKTATPEPGSMVKPGDTLEYTLTVEVTNGPTQSPVVLTDQLGTGLTFVEVTSAGGFVHDPQDNTFTLPAGAVDGVHTVSYTATVDSGARIEVNNSVSGTGGGDPGQPNPVAPSCSPSPEDCETTHPLVPPVLTPVPLGSLPWNALLAGLMGLLAIGLGARKLHRA
ncbi:DUF11 domain-containing protein [Lampropedia aestuarii]|uniref:DUF11 domain-containing protein n=1 Tax=Lampropedia aestuarii TaxID=2562762 RepID=A0A4S5BUD1_9BURK|nr:DUF11 domain-containing protein [Lampropedia aestuarii]THJ36517.1 DUF11 domain-containing protein [Lampropedia aestuarii]